MVKQNSCMFLFNLILAFILCINLNCKPNVNVHNKQSEQLSTNRGDTSIARKELIFKNWLVDTLKVLDTSVGSSHTETIRVKKEINIASDSLNLTILTHYDLQIDSGIGAKPEDVNKLLALLQEYNESPKSRFRLKFKTEYYFTPSPVPNFAHDLTFENKDIEIIEGGGKVVSKYSYIRGRLAYKNVTSLAKDGSETNEYIDFVWQDNKLIKKKRN